MHEPPTENENANNAEIGPIVRIYPNELSINDPEAYNNIYVAESRRRTDNYHSFIKGIDFDDKQSAYD